MTTLNRDTLFLLKPDFADGAHGPYFCPGCAQMLGLLEYYQALKERLDIVYVDFLRPRPAIVELIGEENQSCPVLVLKGAPVADEGVRRAKGCSFVEGPDEIARYLARTRGIGIPH